MIPRQHLWILGTLLVIVVLLTVLGLFKETQEGFQTAAAATTRPIRITLPRCPANYTFFNDAEGASFCCKGNVNPYTHTCEATLPEDLCAFSKGILDPRDSKRMLELCSALGEQQYVDASNNKCPRQFPHYATDGVKERCCKTGLTPDGSACIAADAADTSRYCVVNGVLAEGEKKCTDLKMLEDVSCPANQGFTQVNYMLGAREAAKYGEGVRGAMIPACFRLNETCIPDAAITYAQTEFGAFTGRNLYSSEETAPWAWACSTWKAQNVDGDYTVEPVMAYP